MPDAGTSHAQCGSAVETMEEDKGNIEECQKGGEMDSLIDSSSSSTLRSCGHCENPPSVGRYPKCFSCNEAIMLPQERFRPCSCTVLVHTFCALNDEKWISRKCSSCGELFRQPQTITSVSSFSNNKLPNDRPNVKCFICGASSPTSRSGFRSDFVMIRPCICELWCHHQCIASRVLTERHCKVCGVYYRYRKYGSLWDFFTRYRCQYCCSVSLFIVLFSISAFAVIKSFSKAERFSLARMFLLLIGVALFVTSVVFMWMWFKYTIIRRIPRFNTRYKRVTVFDYEPPLSPNITQLRPRVSYVSLEDKGAKERKPKSFGSYLEAKGFEKKDVKSAEIKSRAILLPNIDSSLEERLLSTDSPASWQTSSTPIVETDHKVFAFESPAGVKKKQGL